MPRRKLTPIDRELNAIQSSLIFGALMARLTWGWRTLDDWQQGLLDSRARYTILNASRQSGKSSTLALKIAHTAIMIPNGLILIIAEQRQSNEDMRKVKEILRKYDSHLKSKYKGSVNLNMMTDNVTSVELGHGSRVIALPGNEKVRGYSAPDLVVIDEAGYVDDVAFAAVDPMIEVNRDAQLMIAGTPNGTEGFYYNEWKNPRYGDPGLYWPKTNRFKIPYEMCPRIERDSVEQKRLIYGDLYIKQEYECIFLDDIASLFSEASLRASMDDSEDVFQAEMDKVNQIIQGGAEMI